MLEKKEQIWVSRYQIVGNQMMRGMTGKFLSDRRLVQAYMIRLKSYNERKNTKGSITHFVTLEDVNKWNKNIEDRLKKNNNFNRYEHEKEINNR